MWQAYAQWAFNVQCTRDYSLESVPRELAAILRDAGIGTVGTDLFHASTAVMPTGTGPYVFVTMTGGLGPVNVHDSPLPHQQRPFAQVIVRARNDPERTLAGGSAAAERKAREAYAALASVVNLDVTAV